MPPPSNETADAFNKSRRDNGSSVAINAAEKIRVEVEDSAWEVVLPSNGQAGPIVELAAQTIPSRVELLATFLEQPVPRSTIVERAWLQTWLTSRERQDRAVFRIRTNEDEISVTMPDSASSAELMVVVDGKGVPAQLNGDLQVKLQFTSDEDNEDADGTLRPHVVEFGWRSQHRFRAWSHLPFEPPRIAGAWTQQVRWQVLTPNNQLLLWPPDGMETDSATSWWPQERPSVSQQELEEWVGATEQPSPESTAYSSTQRQYLFATVGEVDNVAATSLSAGLGMLVVCGLSAAVCSVLIYVPRVRHPSVLLAISISLAYLAFRWPAAALFAGQTMALLLAVMLVSQVLQRLVFRRRASAMRRSVAVHSSSARPSTRIRKDSALVAIKKAAWADCFWLRYARCRRHSHMDKLCPLRTTSQMCCATFASRYLLRTRAFGLGSASSSSHFRASRRNSISWLRQPTRGNLVRHPSHSPHVFTLPSIRPAWLATRWWAQANCVCTTKVKRRHF